MRAWLPGIGLVLAGGVVLAAEPKSAATSAVERGREALLTRSFAPPVASMQAFDNLWKQWGLKEKPSDYNAALLDRYGLQTACYNNHGLPMGLRESRFLLLKGVGVDCMLCHSGRIAGQTVFGLGNTSIDMQGLFTDLAAGDGFKQAAPFQLSHVRGNIEAVGSTMFLMGFRNPDLSLRVPPKVAIRDDLCEDIPAWWLMKKKKTLYHTGSLDARAVRSMMAFMLSPLASGESIKKEEPTFRDIKAFLLTLEAPKYPFPVDATRAAQGKELFVQTCARCHGTYGPGGSYPNKIVPVDTVGTDPSLTTSHLVEAGDHYNQSWFGQELGPDGKPYQGVETLGYQAPPLDGVWATAPYFHNGSVPTLYHVLNSKARPRVFTRSYRTEKDDYDPVKAGHKITVLEASPDPKLPGYEQRKIYDTTQPGRNNGGHTFGDKFTEEERMAVIEYLKTL